MFRRSALLAFAALLVSLALSSKAHAWGCYHVGYTHYSPYTGFHHYGSTGFHYGGYGGGGGYHYGGYHYGGYGGGGGYHYGYARRW
jgi:hypothetical protein